MKNQPDSVRQKRVFSAFIKEYAIWIETGKDMMKQWKYFADDGELWAVRTRFEQFCCSLFGRPLVFRFHLSCVFSEYWGGIQTFHRMTKTSNFMVLLSIMCTKDLEHMKMSIGERLHRMPMVLESWPLFPGYKLRGWTLQSFLLGAWLCLQSFVGTCDHKRACKEVACGSDLLGNLMSCVVHYSC